MQTELDTTRGSLEYRMNRRDCPPRISLPRTMTLRIPLSKAASRTSAPSISNLMQTALENPGIVSLAAGFVDQQSLPVEVSARSVSAMFAERGGGAPVAPVRHDDRSSRAAGPADRAAGADRGGGGGDVSGGDRPHGRDHRLGPVDLPGLRGAARSRRHRAGGVADVFRLSRAGGDPRRPGGPGADRRAGAADRRAGADALAGFSDRGPARPGQADLHDPRARQPDRDQPGGRAARSRWSSWSRRWSDAASRRIFVLEDAAYHGLSYGVHEPPSLWSLDRDARDGDPGPHVQQDLQPGVKIGYGVLPRGLIDPILRLKGNHDFGSANFNQQLLEQALASGDYDRHVARLRELYGGSGTSFWRRSSGISSPFGADVHWTHPNGGLFVWMTVPEGLDTGFDGPLFPRCLQEGVLYVPGEYAFAPEPARSPEPPPADLRRARRGRAGRRGPAAGRGAATAALERGRLRPCGRREQDRRAGCRGESHRVVERLTWGKDA